jgi:hypothetical protein
MLSPMVMASPMVMVSLHRVAVWIPTRSRPSFYTERPHVSQTGWHSGMKKRVGAGFETCTVALDGRRCLQLHGGGLPLDAARCRVLRQSTKLPFFLGKSFC